MRPESIPPAVVWALVQDSRGFPVCRVPAATRPGSVGARPGRPARLPGRRRRGRRLLPGHRPRRVFNGARLGRGCRLRINALVRLRTVLPPGTLVPLIAPRERHEDIWAVQRELNFPGYVWGLPRPAAGSAGVPGDQMPEITSRFAGSSAATPRTTRSSTAPTPPPPPE